MESSNMSHNKTLLIFSLEPLENRYTHEWFTHLPQKLKEDLGCEWTVHQINGITFPQKTSVGGFLDFTGTNIWKNEQANLFFGLSNFIPDDSILLFCDFWNPIINEIQYCRKLMGKNWKIISIAHAGGYDPHDFLGRLGEKTWLEAAEISFFSASDKVIFASDWHVDLFLKTFEGRVDQSKIARCGFPMEYIMDMSGGEKENLILFPHRLAPEKQRFIFDILAKRIPEYGFVVCQDYSLSKDEYHKLLRKAKVVFSASLQETFGISMIEGVFSDAIPIVPDSLSYKEMYLQEFRYDISGGFDVSFLESKIRYMVENYQNICDSLLPKQKEKLIPFISTEKISKLVKEMVD